MVMSMNVGRMPVSEDKDAGRGADTGGTPLGTRYEVDGRHLLLHRSGSGGPAVVFLPGAGLVGFDYLNITEQVSSFTTSVLYDRAGTGWSDSARLPRRAEEVVDELRRLLQASDIPGPYVLVGHSLGGAYARRYAQSYPDEVAGIVLLDPFCEGYLGYKQERPLAGTLWQIFAAARLATHVKSFYRCAYERMLADWPESVRGPLISYHLRELRTTMKEHKNLNTEVVQELRSGGALPDVPVILLAAMGIDPFQAVLMPRAQLLELNKSKPMIYKPITASTERCDYRPVEGAGHTTLHTDRPDAVVAAIRDVLDGAR
jgi:pimeloyl-ACP methyl ester carboxylesterase